MRIYFAVLIAVLLSLNATYAAAAGICDALEEAHNHALHVGHHSHEHGNGHSAQSSDAEDIGKVHLHDHAHSSFSFLQPGIIDAEPLTGCNSLLASPASNFDSAPQSSLDRPPRAALA